MNKKLKYSLLAAVSAVLISAGALKVATHPQPPQLAVGHDKFTTLVQSHPEVWFQTERDLTQFSADLTAGRMSDIAISPSYLFAQLKGGYRYYVTASGGNYLVAKMLEGHIQDKNLKVVTTGYIEPPQSFATNLFEGFSFSAAFAALLSLSTIAMMIIMMRLVIGDRKSFTVEKRGAASFKDVVGVEDAKQALGDIVAYLKDPQRYVSLGAKPPRGVLLEGPPGTGKTMLARALAGECGASFIAVNGSEFSAKFLGVGVGRVQKLFKVAKKHGPVIVFIDEMDGIGKRTDGTGGNGGAAEQENNRIINEFLTQLDGFRPTEGVIVVGATNHSGNIDPALKREGRFDRTCRLNLPNINDREKLFELNAAAKPMADDVQYRQLARLSAGLSPAAIAGAVNMAAVRAVKSNATTISNEDLLAALEQQSLGAPNDGMAKAMSSEERRRISIHESGHALIAKLVGDGVVEKVTNIPRAEALGVTWVTREQEQHLMTQEQLENRLEVLLGGRLAERLILSSVSSGASHDLEVASRTAFNMAGHYGFSHRIGPFSLAGLKGEPTEQFHAEVIAEARQILNAAEQRATQRLLTNRRALEMLTEQLLEHETVSGDVVDACLAAGTTSRAGSVRPDVSPAALSQKDKTGPYTELDK